MIGSDVIFKPPGGRKHGGQVVTGGDKSAGKRDHKQEREGESVVINFQAGQN